MTFNRGSLLLQIILLMMMISSFSRAQNNLSTDFYAVNCPSLLDMVREGVSEAMDRDRRIPASLIRLHFHDCFVNASIPGCDGSILLDGSDGEKAAAPNLNSARGFEVVDAIKASVEEKCPLTVSCADVLTLAARDAVLLSGGPSWDVPLGRRDSRTSNKTMADSSLPSPFSTLEEILSKFQEFGLDIGDVVSLSGAHTIGLAHCRFVRGRLYDFNRTGHPDPTLNATYASILRRSCPKSGNDSLLDMDPRSPEAFDNAYYKELEMQQGMFQSDQVLLSTTESAAMVKRFRTNKKLFYQSFARSMVRMGSIRPLTGRNGEIRKDCRKVN